tara:strand:+ start:224 stop:568 length:345 start_codon:yes stop_codon:yes gene_type:complete
MIRGIPTINWYLLPIIITACGTAPVTTPPAEACSPRLDGEPTFCPPMDGDLPPKPLIPREEIKGEIDIWNPHHFILMEQMFIKNARRNQIEKTMTQPDDAIDEALANMEWLEEE